jgi:uncharacterized protein (TIGR02246 family)
MLRFSSCILILLSLLLISSCEKKNSQQEEFQKIANDFESAWNQHNPQAFTNLWAEDGNLISPWGGEFTGRKEIEQHFAEEHGDSMKNSEMNISVRNVRFIDPEVAFVDADITLSGMTVGGEKADPLHDHAIFLVVKRDGKWQILVARPY